MNRRSSGLQLSKALVGFLQYKAAEGLSPNTLCSYEHHLKVWLEYAGAASDIEGYAIRLLVVQGGYHALSRRHLRHSGSCFGSLTSRTRGPCTPLLGTLSLASSRV